MPAVIKLIVVTMRCSWLARLTGVRHGEVKISRGCTRRHAFRCQSCGGVSRHGLYDSTSIWSTRLCWRSAQALCSIQRFDRRGRCSGARERRLRRSCQHCCSALTGLRNEDPPTRVCCKWGYRQQHVPWPPSHRGWPKVLCCGQAHPQSVEQAQIFQSSWDRGLG